MLCLSQSRDGVMLISKEEEMKGIIIQSAASTLAGDNERIQMRSLGMDRSVNF